MELVRQFAKAEYSVDRNVYIAFEETLGLVLMSKKRRFADQVAAVSKISKIDPAQTFLDITRPLDQIRLLTEATHTFLSYAFPSQRIMSRIFTTVDYLL